MTKREKTTVVNGGDRNKKGALASFIGILLNLCLCAAKITVGAIFGSVSVVGDGFNNLTDIGSSVIGMIGFRFASKPADKDHPFGHARYEYVTGLIVAFIVLTFGIQLVRDSIEKIVENGSTEFSVITVGILAASIAVKLFMFVFYRITAKKINSGTLKATSIDSLNDAVATTVILICALVAHFAGVELDAYAGIAVALFIIINGIKLTKETTSPLLGEKPSAEFVKSVGNKILSYDGVKGIHDLMVHNYGPNRNYLSVHVEVDAKTDILVSHELVDKIERELLAEGVNAVIHMDPVICDDERVDKMKETVKSCLAEIDEKLTIHDFRVVWGENRINLIFDIETPYGYKISDEDLKAELSEKVKEKDARCALVVTVDKDYAGMI